MSAPRLPVGIRNRSKKLKAVASMLRQVCVIVNATNARRRLLTNMPKPTAIGLRVGSIIRAATKTPRTANRNQPYDWLPAVLGIPEEAPARSANNQTPQLNQQPW